MIAGTRISLRDKKLSDARHDYDWQTDPELARLDATTPLAMSYTRYLLDYALELRAPSSQRRRLAIDTLGGQHIGNCSYYDIDLRRGEAQLGIMIGERGYWDKGYGTDAVTALLSYIFGETKLERIYLKTLNWNTRAQKCFQKCGFRKYGQMVNDGFNFLLMEVTRQQLEERQPE